MSGTPLLVLALLAQDPRVLTVQDALLTIEGVSGPVQVVEDLDGDGVFDCWSESGSKGTATRSRPGWRSWSAL